MLTRRILALTAAATLGAFVIPASAEAAPAATDHGTFSEVIYTTAAGTQTTSPAAGTWNVAVHGSTVGTATFNIFVDGVHHLAYGIPGQQVTPTPDGWTFNFPTLAGQLYVTLDGNTLTYDIPDYSYEGTSLADVTYVGHVGK